MAWCEHFTGRSLALLALAAAAGVFIADRSAALPLFIPGLVVIGMAAAWLTLRRGQWRWPVLLAMVVFALFHTVNLREARLHPLRLALEQRTTSMSVVAVGRVDPTLRSDLPGAEPGQATFVATEVRCPLTGEVWRGRTTLRLFPGQNVELTAGSYRIEGRLRLPLAPDNPGQFDGRNYRLRLGLVADLSASRVQCLQPDRWNLYAMLASAAENCRAWITRTLSIDLANRPDERAIILAMALGTIEPEAKQLEEPFQQSGTLHIFAVSGLHVAIVGIVFLGLLRPFGLRRGVLVGVLIAVVFGYAFVTGLRPSAIRAAVMFAVVLIGVGFHRRTDVLNSLGAAALLLLAWDTQQLFAPGFQLSFFVIVFIASLATWFTKPLRPWIDPDPFLPKPLLTGWEKRWWTFRRHFAGLFTVSAAAALGSLPLMFGHFHLVTPVSLLANAVLVPLSFLVLGTAILTMLCGLLHVTCLQVLFSNANLAFAWGSLTAAQLFAGIPGGNFHLHGPTFSAQPPAELTVLRLPAGGAAQHLRIGKCQWLLDAGPEKNFPFVVRPYLQYSGINRLDGLILSHSDYEHIGATLPILQQYGQPPMWEPAREPWRWETGGSSFRGLHAHGVHASSLAQGGTLDFGHSGDFPAKAMVLHPTLETWPRRSDDRTLVLRLDLGPYRILWCNDAGFQAEKTMLETLPDGALRCDVLIRNQHAGDFSLLPEFLDAVQPRILISSNDTFPPEQNLPSRIREDCAKRSIQLLDQRETGAVMLRIWPDRMAVSATHALPEVSLLPAPPWTGAGH
jgi:ComEC/Rec2-related protein